MIIEIKGTNSVNKGAEMMLLTTLEELRDKNIKFTAVPQKVFFEYSFYSKLGIYPKIWKRYKGISLDKIGKITPKYIRDLFGLVLDREVNIILDVSGFAYSSQWGDAPAEAMAKQSKYWKQKNKKIILLPQAFGPFKTDKIKSAMKDIINNSTRIYARDTLSYQELLKIVNDKNKIKLSPDFTILFKGITPLYFNPKVHQICIVPNQRMKDKIEKSDQYEMLFARIIAKLQKNNFQPFFLIHGGEEDYLLAKKINSLLTKDIEIITEDDPYFIKGIIENSIGLIGSRYHSLASGLYSGVPTIGTGWSHKYEYLFKEFNFIDGLINLEISNEDLDNKLKVIINEKRRKKTTEKLLENTEIIKKKAHKMFNDIKKEIDIPLT